MRRTFTKSGLLAGCVLALGAAGCSDSNGGGNNTPDSGSDSGTPADSGTDSGTTTDAGQDAGTDASTPQPLQLRLAHLAFGSDVGPAHICARLADGVTRVLVTSSALAGGSGTPTAQPLPYGTITRHLSVPVSQLTALAGATVEVWRASDITAVPDAFVGMVCVPNTPDGGAAAQPLATAGIGTGAGQVPLAPGSRMTVAVTGAQGAEFAGQCQNNTCLPVGLVAMADEASNTSTTTARLRTVLADPRFGQAPGVCSYDFGASPTTAAPVMTSGIVALATAATVPAYADESPLGPTIVPDGDGGVTGVPKLLSLHMAGTAGAPCVVVTDPDAGLPMNGVIGAGILPNQGLIDAFAANPLGATVLGAIGPGDVSTIFIAPQLLEFRDLAMAMDGGLPPLCAPGSSQTCQPLPCNLPSATCNWVPLAIPVDDAQ